MQRIVLNGDDFGLSDGVCRAILELLERGAISNTTIMTVLRDGDTRLRKWGVSDLRGVAGVHLQLSGGTPLSTAKDIPSLVDHVTGEFLPRTQIGQADPQHVHREWRAQIMLAADLLGGPPTHMDSHHGFHRNERFSGVYLDLAQEFRLPVRGGEGHLAAQMAARGIRGSTVFVRGWSGQEKTTDFLKDQIRSLSASLREDQVLEVTTHPGYNDAYLESASSMNKAREGDRNTVSQLASEGWLRSNGLTLVRYPDFQPVAPQASRTA